MDAGTQRLLQCLLALPLLCGAPAALAKPEAPVQPAAMSSATTITTTTITGVSQHDKDMSASYGSHLQPILTIIKASPEQKVKITSIVEVYRPRIQPLKAEYREKSKEFVDMLIQNQSAETIMSRQGELNKVYSLILTQYMAMQLEIRRQLSPQQAVLFEQYRRQQGWTQASNH